MTSLCLQKQTCLVYEMSENTINKKVQLKTVMRKNYSPPRYAIFKWNEDEQVIASPILLNEDMKYAMLASSASCKRK